MENSFGMSISRCIAHDRIGVSHVKAFILMHVCACVCVHSNGDHQWHLCSINSQLNIRNGFENAFRPIDSNKLRTSAAAAASSTHATFFKCPHRPDDKLPIHPTHPLPGYHRHRHRHHHRLLQCHVRKLLIFCPTCRPGRATTKHCRTNWKTSKTIKEITCVWPCHTAALSYCVYAQCCHAVPHIFHSLSSLFLA